MEGKSVQSDHARGQGRRFVLLVRSDAPRPRKLIEGLRQKQVAVRMVPDAPMAMVEIAQFKPQVLIVHNARSMPDLESLLAAVRMYHPRVICWRHEPASEGKAERLLPFACELIEAPQPRFTPAPDGPLQTPVGSDRSNPAGSQPPNGHAPLANRSPSAKTNGQTSSTNGKDHPAGRSNPMAGPLARPPSSLGHRLAQPLDAMDDLSTPPLLTAEEIELLRGPAEDDDISDSRRSKR